MEQEASGGWKHLPEFVTTSTYVRCIDRLFQSLPPRVRLRMFRPMVSAAVRIGVGIACFHGHPEPPRTITAADREGHRQSALAGIRASRKGLDRIARADSVDRARLTVARALLDRVEGSVKRARLPAGEV